MSYRKPIDRVEDYTDAFLATLFLFLFMGFWVIAAAVGYIWVAITAFVLHRGIRLLARFKQTA